MYQAKRQDYPIKTILISFLLTYLISSTATAQSFTPLSATSRYYCVTSTSGDTVLQRLSSSGYEISNFKSANKSFKKSIRNTNRVIGRLKKAMKGASKKKRAKLKKNIKRKQNQKKIIKAQQRNLKLCKQQIPIPENFIVPSIEVLPSKNPGQIVIGAFLTIDIPTIPVGGGQFLDTGSGSSWCVVIKGGDNDSNFAPPYGAAVTFYDDICDNISEFNIPGSCKNYFGDNTISWQATGILGLKEGSEASGVETVAANIADLSYTVRPQAGERNCGRPLN